MNETWLGFAIGIATAGYLWVRSGQSSADAQPKYIRQLRDFLASDLAIYDGKDGRLCYVALAEPETGVYDVSSDSAEYLKFGGKEADASVDADKVKAKFAQVGKFIRPREYTVDELFEMDGRGDKPIWLAAKGEVFDVSKGGRDFYGPDSGYSCMAGRDASRALALVSLEKPCIDNNRIDDLTASDIMTLDEWRMKFHSKYTCIGTLKDWSPAGSPIPAKAGGAAALAIAATTAEAAPFLTRERQKVVLGEKIKLSPDTFLFRFHLPNRNSRLGLPIGKHIKFWCPNPSPKVAGEWNGRPDTEFGKPEVERKYTPSTLDSEALGHFDVIIKVYRPNERFVDGGKMSQFFGDLQVGQSVDVAGPFGLIEYKGQGTFSVSKKEIKASYLGLMAGGTGVTPMLQLIKAVLFNPADKTKISLVFANQTEEDILLRDMLDELQTKFPDQFRLHYTVDRPPASGWKYSTGFITEEMLQKQMPPAGPETMMYACGPPPMVKFACKGNLEKLGYDVTARFAEF